MTLFFKEYIPEGGKELFAGRLPARNPSHYCSDPQNAENAVFGLPQYFLDVFTTKLGQNGLTIAAAGNIAEQLGELFFQRARSGEFKTAKCTVFTRKVCDFLPDGLFVPPAHFFAFSPVLDLATTVQAKNRRTQSEAFQVHGSLQCCLGSISVRPCTDAASGRVTTGALSGRNGRRGNRTGRLLVSACPRKR